MNGQTGAEWLAKFHARLNEAVEVLAKEGLAVLRESLSRPSPPVSAPGEEPHEEKSGADSLVGQTEAITDGADTEFSSNAAESAYLEFGTHKLQPRPFMRPHKEYMRQHYIPALASLLRKSTM